MTAIEAAMEFLRAGSSSVAPSPELLAHVEELVQALRRGELAPSDIWAVGAMHPRSEVRLALVVEAASRNGDEDAEALIAWAVNDPDDTIAVTAAAAAARRADGGALEGLFDASGRSLAALSGARSAHADLRRRAAVDSLHHLMSSLPNGEDVRRNLAWTGYDQRQSLRGREFNTVEMVEIPAGPGAPYGFFIDTTPVTWRAYMEFVKATEEHGPVWSHPGQPSGHDHHVGRRLSSQQLDRLATHPVTGVTWFDAWAYASWRGKKLPSAGQWERAAGVLDKAEFPWGDASPTPENARFLVSAGEALHSADLAELTAEVGTHPAGATPGGVHDLAGNVWEWTRSRALDVQDITPFIGAVDYGATLGNWTLSACIKGGGWSSGPDDLRGAVRASKHVLQRGPETGFRCVIEPHGE
ncbi:formylglycine-generating enzyme family protein [Streptomyces sp. NBC_01794]|uniref:formylglycine-generating enzyme family protein n=1 Tax=Streptomyces sp. NBC_01794 TaxID=2975942 RepID=UPI003088EF03|nr:formylglycine-generating enzyme family protein [Streptomyces sp. NBC_01794]